MTKQAEDPGCLQKAIDALDHACMASAEFLVGVQSHERVIHQSASESHRKLKTLRQPLDFGVGDKIDRRPSWMPLDPAYEAPGKTRRKRHQRNAEMGLVGDSVIRTEMDHHAMWGPAQEP